MILQEIHLLAGRSNQYADVTIGRIPFTIRMLWNTYGEYWSLSVAEYNGPTLLENVKVVPYWPLTGRYQCLGLVGDLYLLHKAGKTTRPTFEDIGGVTYGLYYYDPETATDLPVPVPPIGSLSTIWDDGRTKWDGGDTVWF